MVSKIVLFAAFVQLCLIGSAKSECVPLTLRVRRTQGNSWASADFELTVKGRYNGHFFKQGDAATTLDGCSKDGMFCASTGGGASLKVNNQVSTWKSASQHIDGSCGGLAQTRTCTNVDDYYSCVSY